MYLLIMIRKRSKYYRDEETENPVFLLREDLIKKIEHSNISTMGKNIGSTIKHYEAESIIPRSITMGLGRGKGVVSVFLYDIIEILNKISNLKVKGYQLHYIKDEIEREFYSYFIYLELQFILDKFNFSEKIRDNLLNAYVKSVDSTYSLTDFASWLNIRFKKFYNTYIVPENENPQDEHILHQLCGKFYIMLGILEAHKTDTSISELTLISNELWENYSQNSEIVRYVNSLIEYQKP